MRFGINTLDDFEIMGKTVLCRVDINQPIDREKGQLKSQNRVEACVPTVKELSDRGAKVVLLAHQGSDIEYQNFYTTAPHAKVLSQLMGRDIRFVEDVCGPYAQEAIRDLKSGEILLLDNVRFVSEEQTLFEMQLGLTPAEQAETLLVRRLSPLADLYVCDAFAAAHRSQPSLCGFEEKLPSAMGRLFEKEYCTVSGILQGADHPSVFVLGGAKISDAFLMMETVLGNGAADQVLTGGLVGNLFLAATGVFIGEGSLEALKKINDGKLLKRAAALYQKYERKIFLPVDLAWVEDGERKEAEAGAVAKNAAALDIGKRTVRRYRDRILKAKTVFVNGPMGVFEQEITEYGSKEVWKALAETDGYTVIGGGDSIAATEKFGCKEQMSYLCTGGGALIRFLSGEELPVVRALRRGAELFGKEKG